MKNIDINTLQQASDSILTKHIPDNWYELSGAQKICFVEKHCTEAFEYVAGHAIIDLIHDVAAKMQSCHKDRTYCFLFGEKAINIYLAQPLDVFIDRVVKNKEVPYFVESFNDDTSLSEVLHCGYGHKAQAITLGDFDKIKMVAKVA